MIKALHYLFLASLLCLKTFAQIKSNDTLFYDGLISNPEEQKFIAVNLGPYLAFGPGGGATYGLNTDLLYKQKSGLLLSLTFKNSFNEVAKSDSTNNQYKTNAPLQRVFSFYASIPIKKTIKIKDRSEDFKVGYDGKGITRLEVHSAIPLKVQTGICLNIGLENMSMIASTKVVLNNYEYTQKYLYGSGFETKKLNYANMNIGYHSTIIAFGITKFTSSHLQFNILNKEMQKRFYVNRYRTFYFDVLLKAKTTYDEINYYPPLAISHSKNYTTSISSNPVGFRMGYSIYSFKKYLGQSFKLETGLRPYVNVRRGAYLSMSYGILIGKKELKYTKN